MSFCTYYHECNEKFCFIQTQLKALPQSKERIKIAHDPPARRYRLTNLSVGHVRRGQELLLLLASHQLEETKDPKNPVFARFLHSLSANNERPFLVHNHNHTYRFTLDRISHTLLDALTPPISRKSTTKQTDRYLAEQRSRSTDFPVNRD